MEFQKKISDKKILKKGDFCYGIFIIKTWDMKRVIRLTEGDLIRVVRRVGGELVEYYRDDSGWVNGDCFDEVYTTPELEVMYDNKLR